MIRTVPIGFWLGKTSKGDGCMRHKLKNKRITVEDLETGKVSVFEPPGLLMIVRDKRRKSDKAPEYKLIEVSDDDQPQGGSDRTPQQQPQGGARVAPSSGPPVGVSSDQQARARKWTQENMSPGESPF